MIQQGLSNGRCSLSGAELGQCAIALRVSNISATALTQRVAKGTYNHRFRIILDMAWYIGLGIVIPDELKFSSKFQYFKNKRV